MAISKEELQTIKNGVNKAKKKPMAFAFAKGRKDGAKEPVLEIDLRPSAVRKSIRETGKPPLMWGSLQMLDGKTMAFIVDKGKVKPMQQALMKGLKKAHPLLTSARVLTREEFEATQSAPAMDSAAPEADVLSEEASSARSDAQTRVIETKRAALQDALGRFVKERDRIKVELESADETSQPKLQEELEDLVADFQEQRDAYAAALA